MSRIRTVFGLVVVLAAAIWSGPAAAQSVCQYIAAGAVLTAGQWNSCFAKKADYPQPSTNVRTRLTGATTFYVNGSTGSDTNFPCTSLTSPCLTKQAVANNLQNSYDLAGQAVTISSTGDSTTLVIDGPFVGDVSGNALPLVTFVGDPSLAITNCTNATPIVVSAAGHTYVNGDHIIISGVLGNLNCNGAFVVASSNQGAGTFALTNENGGGNIAGSGPYSSGGTVQAPYRQLINGGSGNAIRLVNGAQANFSGFAMTTTAGIDFYCNVGSRCYLTGKMDFQGSGATVIGITSNKAAYLEIDDSFSINIPNGEDFVHEPHSGVLFVVSPAYYLRGNCSFPTSNSVNAAFIMATDSDTSWTPTATTYGFTCTSTIQWLIRDKGSIQVNPSGFGGGQIPPPDGWFPGDTVGQYQTSIAQNATPAPGIGPGYFFTNSAMYLLGPNIAAGTLNFYSSTNSSPSGDSIRFWVALTNNLFTLLGNGNIGQGDNNPQFNSVINLTGVNGLTFAGLTGLFSQVKFSVPEVTVGFAGAASAGAMRADGTASSPTSLASGDLIGCNSWGGYNSASTTFTAFKARVCGVATDNYTNSTQGTAVEIDATPAGSTTRTQSMRLMAGVFVGSSASPTDRGAGILEAATGFYANGSQGLSCSGTPSSSFASVGGIVTHC